MNYTLGTDQFMSKKMDAFDIYWNSFGMAEPFGVSGFCQFPKPVVASWSSWLQAEDNVQKLTVVVNDESPVTYGVGEIEMEEVFEINEEDLEEMD